MVDFRLLSCVVVSIRCRSGWGSGSRWRSGNVCDCIATQAVAPQIVLLRIGPTLRLASSFFGISVKGSAVTLS